MAIWGGYQATALVTVAGPWKKHEDAAVCLMRFPRAEQRLLHAVLMRLLTLISDTGRGQPRPVSDHHSITTSRKVWRRWWITTSDAA